MLTREQVKAMWSVYIAPAMANRRHGNRFTNMTPQERSEAAQHASMKRWAKVHANKPVTMPTTPANPKGILADLDEIDRLLRED
jgi:histidinol-phosphate/aromatic aminotransferase/cobyric acid decarboxylase-like protein